MDTIPTAVYDAVRLLFFVSFFVFGIRLVTLGGFIRTLLIVGGSLGAIISVISFVTFDLRLEAAQGLFGFEGPLFFVREFSSISYFLIILFTTTLLIGPKRGEPGADSERPRGTPKHLGLMLLYMIITFGIYNTVWIYKTVRDLRTHFGDVTKYTPGLAVGLLFVPIVNLFWGIFVAVTLPLSIKKAERMAQCEGRGPHLHPVLITLLWLMGSVLSGVAFLGDRPGGYIVAGYTVVLLSFLAMQAKINAFWDTGTLPVQEPVAVGGRVG